MNSETTQPLAGKVAIVTGAGRGIGAATARKLATAGAHVTINDVNPDRAEQVAANIRAAGGSAIGIAADVSNKFQCVNLVETTRDQWNRLDILINNAAVMPRSPILKLDEWDWNRCLEVNLKGTFFMTQLCGRVMADENGEAGGVIVNVSSTAGVLTALPGRAAYCASSAAVVGFARECAREFADYHIRVNTVLLGVFDTPMGEQLDPDGKQTAVIPLGRPGEANEAANAILFLCSPESSYMTGSTLTVDGGQTMR